MKAAAEKSSTTSTTATQAVHQPFFAKAGGGTFFSPAIQNVAPAVQMKMAVNQPGDKFEQEADKTADKVMRMAAAESPVKEEKLQRQVEDKLQKAEEDKIQKAGMPEEKIQKAEDEKIQKAPATEEKLQRKENGAPALGPSAQSAIQNQTAGGQPLSSEVRSYMEPRFGADFSNVRVHNDGESAGLSNQLSARAFTYQNHVFFSRDQYQPGTSDGKQLLAHELTHTLQQGATVQRSTKPTTTITPPLQRQVADETIHRAPAAADDQLLVSSEVVDISSNTFNPSEKVRAEIEAQGRRGLAVRVIVKGVTAEGRVRIRVDPSKNYDSIETGSMPLLNAWAQQIGGMHLNFTVKNNEISGFASLKAGGGDKNGWLEPLRKNASLLGGLGLKVGQLPTPINKFDNGKLTLGATDIKVEVGGFVDANFNLLLENANKPKIDATADIKVKGIGDGKLKLDNTQDKLTGEVSLAINLKAFSGVAKIKYNADGTVDISGKGAYNANKLSGEIQFVATDLDAANSFAKDAISAAGGKENVQSAAPPAPVPLPKAGKKQRALAATGQLAFNLTTWFAGSVIVVVDAEGDITVIGKIAPPAEIELFKQKDWDKELIKFEAKAYYGIPVVGNLNLFANISLHALAKLGPARINNIEILGTYSTKPEIQKSIQISGSINISAYAGLRLRAEGGAGIEIVSHDLKFGVGLNADVGVKAYADARPTIGYREPGEFYVSGTLEMVAQPMLGLGGDFFIELETPWWSPLSDDKWIWPLFSKEWPLSDPIGINASVKDYVLGSGKVPEVEIKKPEFDPSKFMTNMVDRTLPDKSSGQGAGQGTFKEDGTVLKPTVPPKKPEPKKAEAKPGKKAAPPKAGKSGAPDPKAAKDQENTKIFQNAAKPLAALKGKAPFTSAELNQELAKIKGQVSGIDFGVQQKATSWIVSPKAGGKTGKAFELAAKDVKEGVTDGKVDVSTGDKFKEASFKKTFNMGPESHTIKANLHEGKLHVTIESAEATLVLALRAAIATEAKDTTRPESQRNKILAELRPALQRAESIEQDWIVAEARDPRGGNKKIIYERFMSVRVAEITSNLRSLGKYNITDLQQILAKPKKRYIPKIIKIRPMLYDAATLGRWESESKQFRDRERSKLSARCHAIWILRNTDFVAAQIEWNKLIASGKLDEQVIPTFRTYDHPKHFPTFPYATDHVKPLGVFWNAGEKNKDDGERSKTTLDQTNWQLLTKRANETKGGVDFDRDVGDDFSSVVADSPKATNTIAGKPFESTQP